MIKPGDQVVYIPNHVIELASFVTGVPIDKAEDGSIQSFSSVMLTQPACEFGFVTSIKDDNAWCRFWARSLGRTHLRTTSCSERTPLANLLKVSWCDGITQDDIDAACDQYHIEIREVP